jgi:hypothetical protein
MTARTRSPSLAPDELDGLPTLEGWLLQEVEFKGLPAYRAGGWLSGHPTIPEGIHRTELIMGFDFAGHQWLEAKDGFYRLLNAAFGAKPPEVFVLGWTKK